jgi:hypothetical protein
MEQDWWYRDKGQTLVSRDFRFDTIQIQSRTDGLQIRDKTLFFKDGFDVVRYRGELMV